MSGWLGVLGEMPGPASAYGDLAFALQVQRDPVFCPLRPIQPRRTRDIFEVAQEPLHLLLVVGEVDGDVQMLPSLWRRFTAPKVGGRPGDIVS